MENTDLELARLDRELAELEREAAELERELAELKRAWDAVDEARQARLAWFRQQIDSLRERMQKAKRAIEAEGGA